MRYERGWFDCEADGLLDTLTTIHCLSLSVDGRNVQRYVGDDIPEGLAILEQCDRIIAHNGIGFDLPALFKVFRWRPHPSTKIHDTSIESRLLNPDRFPGHALEDWGKLIGEEKTDYKARFIEWKREQDSSYQYTKDAEWAEYNPVMGDYCDQDVRVLVKLDKRLENERKNLIERTSQKGKVTNLDDAYWMEHRFAKDFAVQAWRGVYVNKAHTEHLIATLDQQMADIEQRVEPLLPEKPANKGELAELTPPKVLFKKNGEPSAHCLRFCEKHGIEPADIVPGQPIATTVPMQLKDQEALKTWLLDQGWSPSSWNYKKAPDANGKLRIVRGDDGNPVPTQPKLHEKGEICPNLERMIEAGDVPDIAKDVVRWVVLRHRLGLARSIMENLRPDGRVSAQGISLGTPTSRVTHKVVANIPKADEKVLYGKECRAIFGAKRPNEFVGVDAAGLELRCLAHYARSPELVKLVLADKDKGELDIHTVLAQGYAEAWSTVTRNSGKNITYGLLYGASDKKVGQTAGAPDSKAEKVGAACRAVFLGRLPGMDKLMEQVEAAAKRGWVRALDGRIIPIRSKHAALNTLLQSCGSILVKWAQCYMNEQIRKHHIPAWQVISYHDEVQLEAAKGRGREAGQLFIDGLRWAGERFGFTCPLDGEVKVGTNWAETH
mgnify:CR=1 FL=1